VNADHRVGIGHEPGSRRWRRGPHWTPWTEAGS
jgi:hypothetical protein